MNARYMTLEIRDNVGEDTAALWGDGDILRKLNISHRMRATELMQAPGDWLLKKSSSLTPSSSVVTLPGDCVKPVYMEVVSSGDPIAIDTTVRDRRLTRLAGSTLNCGLVDAYLVGNTIEVNEDNFTDPVYLWYQRRIIDLHAGTAAGGGAASLTLENLEANPSDDYYNDATVEVVSGTGATSPVSDTISDYTGSSRVCVVSGTYGSDSVYGTVSDLPEEALPFVMLDATLKLMAKPGAASDPKYFEYYFALWKLAKKDWLDHISSRMHGSNYTRTTELD